MSSERNIIILDTETTGLNPEVGCEVIQISAKAINGWDLSDHHAGELNLIIKPQRPELAQPGAIRLTGELFEQAKATGLDPKVAYKKLIEWINLTNDKGAYYTAPIVIAYNLRFDMMFLKYHLREYKFVKLEENGELNWPWGFEFEAMMMAFTLFESAYDVNNFKLDTALAKLNMSRSTDKHDAMEDVRLLTELFRRGMKFYRNAYSKMKIPNNLPKG